MLAIWVFMASIGGKGDSTDMMVHFEIAIIDREVIVGFQEKDDGGERLERANRWKGKGKESISQFFLASDWDQP